MIEHLKRVGVGLAFILGVCITWAALIAFVELISRTAAYTILITFVVLFGAWFIGCGFRAGKD
jgi:hypothetical protein